MSENDYDPFKEQERLWRENADERGYAYQRDKEERASEANRRFNETLMEIEASDAGMTPIEYQNAKLKRYFVIFACLCGPLILVALAQHILHSVPSAILIPVLTISTIGVAGSTAWFGGKKLGENLNANFWGLLLIRIFIFLFISIFVYTLFYENASFAPVIYSIIIGFLVIFVLGMSYIMLSNRVKSIGGFISSMFSKNNSESVTSQSEVSPYKIFKSISFLFYAGIIMALAVQLASANGWTFLFFKSYEDAFATSIFLIAFGAAHTSFLWHNGYLGFGLISTTIGGFAWKYKWIMPIIGTYEVPLCIGISLILYAVFPRFIGIIFFIAGIFLLGIEIFLALSQGLSAVHYNIALLAIALLGLSFLMKRRHRKISANGLFKLRK